MKKFRKIVLLCAVASLAIAAPAAIVFSANGEVSLNGEYSAYYGRNEIVEIFDGFYDKSGVKTKMNKKLIFPDGSTVKNDFVKLTDVGIYVVEYSISDVSERKTFEVRPSAAGLFERANGFTVTGNVDSYEYMDEKSNGVLLTATKSGATIDYGGIIELDEESKSVSELTPLIDMCFMPKTAGIFEIGELYLRFSDVYDESKYFEVKVVSGINDGEPQNAYIAATTNLGYTHIGLLDFGYRQAISELGTGVKSSLAGKIEGRESGNFQIYYSTNENALYCAPAVLGSGLVLDFDDPAMVGAGNIWIS